MAARGALGALGALLAALAAGSASAAGAAGADLNPLQLAPDHATASVADLDKMTNWYEQVLGFHEVGRNRREGFEVRHLAVPGYRIDLAWEQGSMRPARDRSPYQAQGWMHVVFRAPTEVLARDLQTLTALKTDARGGYDPQGKLFRVYLHDPEGNEVEIVSTAFAEDMNRCLTTPSGCPAPP
jgi:catechol-2,3-dioxygenase